MYTYMNRITFSCIALSTFISQIAFSQSFVEPSKLKQFNITVNFDDYTVKTQMLSQEKKLELDNEKVYMWYTSQKIMETRGGFDGKLIHGTYRAFYLNNQLKEKGCIKYGLRHKEWKYWYADGKLKEVINWKNGVKNGHYELYNDYGQLMAKSTFKNDKLNGKFYTYGSNGKVLEKKLYSNGEEIIKNRRTKKSLREKFSQARKSKTVTEDVPAPKTEEHKQDKKEKKPSQPLFKKKPKKDQNQNPDKKTGTMS
jgi:hypothetical protein